MVSSSSQPHRLGKDYDEPFAIAGLWETWKSSEDEVIRSCTIVTTEPNTFMNPIHNRMPVMLSEEGEARWLEPTEDPTVLNPLLVPHPPELMISYPGSTVVNSPKNKGREIIEPVTVYGRELTRTEAFKPPEHRLIGEESKL